MNKVVVYQPIFKKIEKYQISKSFHELIDILKEDIQHGNKLPRNKWPKHIYKSHNSLLNATGNLWKDEIIHEHPGFRLYYTIDSKNTLRVIVLEVDPHSKTDRYKLGV